MNKAVILVAAAAVTAALIVGLLVWNVSQKNPPPPAARFLPPETMLLVEAPDWPLARTRWRETALWKIIHEPDVAAFLQRPRAWLGKNAPDRETMLRMDGARIRRAFVALASIRENMPHAIGGFEFGDRVAVEAIIAKVRAQAKAASPGGTAKQIQYGGYEIESFSDKGITLAGTFVHDWYFFGNDMDLLKATLDRFTAHKAQGSLAGENAYIQCAGHLPRDPDLEFFARPSAVVDALSAPRSIGSEQAAELRKIRAVAGTTRQEGERMHDTVFVLQPGTPKLPMLTGSTLSLTSSNTLFYCAFAPVLPDKAEMPAASGGSPGPKAPHTVVQLLSGLHAIAGEMVTRGVHSRDIKTALGPEFAVLSDWPKDTLQPTLLAAGQVRDAVAARKLAQALAGGAALSVPDDADGTGYWQLSTGNAQFTPVLALTRRFLLAGIGPENLRRIPVGSLEKSGPFSTAISSVTKPGIALAYLDARAFFVRAYGWLRPMALIWANFIPHAADYVEVRKLPPTESVSKHLFPLTFSASQTGDGLILESTGPVTFFQAAVAISGAGTAAALPLWESKVLLPGVGKP